MRVLAAACAILLCSPTSTQAQLTNGGCDACEPALDLVFVVDSSLTVELTELGGDVGNFNALINVINRIASDLGSNFADYGTPNSGSPRVEVGGVLYENTVLGFPYGPDGQLGSTLAQVKTKGREEKKKKKRKRKKIAGANVSFSFT